MNELMIGSKMTSMQIAEVTGKLHKNILADIRDEAQKLENGGIETGLKFQPSERKDSTGRAIPYYELTKEGVLQLAARYDAVVRAKLIDAVMKQNPNISKPQESYTISDPIERAKAWIWEQEEKKLLDEKVKELAPAAEFGNAVGNSRASILVRDYVKVLAKDGIRIGQDEFFAWLYKKGYIYRTKEFKPQWVAYSQYTELGTGVFHMVERPFSTTEHGDIIKYTVKITGKGQRYFYDKLKASMQV